jgi:hypothetical protein
MRLNAIAKWAIRQSLGTNRGDQLIRILEAVKQEEIDALAALLERIRERNVRDILDDLAILASIDDMVRPHFDQDGKR